MGVSQIIKSGQNNSQKNVPQSQNRLSSNLKEEKGGARSSSHSPTISISVDEKKNGTASGQNFLSKLLPKKVVKK